MEPKPADEPKPMTNAAPATQTEEPKAAVVSESAAVEVSLLDPTLTAGIPGEGPLTDEQIKAWLDKPENH